MVPGFLSIWWHLACFWENCKCAINTRWIELQHEITDVSPSAEPHTPLSGNLEITGVTGSTLPNGALTDRGENQIKRASMTFESGGLGVHSTVATRSRSKWRMSNLLVHGYRPELTTSDYLHNFISITCELRLALIGHNGEGSAKSMDPAQSGPAGWKKCTWQRASRGLCKHARETRKQQLYGDPQWD